MGLLQYTVLWRQVLKVLYGKNAFQNRCVNGLVSIRDKSKTNQNQNQYLALISNH